MFYRLLAIMIVTMPAVTMSGCKKTAEPMETTQQVQDQAPPITEENLDTELDKMEKQIDADIAAEE